MKKLIVIIALFFFINSIYAQKSELGLGIGMSTYFGDLSSESLSVNLKQSHPAFQVFYNYYFNRFVNTRLSLGYGTLSGDDALSSKKWHVERNLSFRTSIFEFSGLVEYNIFGISHRINPFIFSGVNVFHYNPKTLYHGEWVFLQPLGTEGQGSFLHPDKVKYSLYDMSIVFGAGIKFRLSNSLMLSFELGWRRSNSDYIDDVSKDYVNYYELVRTNGQLAADLSDRTLELTGQKPDRKSGSKRGGNLNKDYYTMTFVNFVYSIHSGNPFKSRNRVSCPHF